MNYSRAIKTAVSVWIIGVVLFLLSSFLPLSGNPELQANLTLAIAFIPLGWFGAHYYYQRGTHTPAYQLALVMAITAALLDALITVPLFFMPNQIGYAEFFGALGFWLLMAEYTGIVMLYGLLKRQRIPKTA